jgi:hypothetical protein
MQRRHRDARWQDAVQIEQVLLPRVINKALAASPKCPATKQLQLVQHVLIIFPELQQICRRLLM